MGIVVFLSSLRCERHIMAKKKKVLLAIETSRSYGRGLLRGIFRYSNLHHSWTLMESPFLYRQSSYFYHNELRTSSKALSYLQKNEVDGVIMRDVRNLKEVRALKMPVISASYIHEDPGIACIQTNCRGIGKLAANHFLDRGFRNFGYCGLEGRFWSRLRREGFQKRVEKSGYDVGIYRQPKLKKDRVWTREQHFLADWLKRLPLPIGIFACNDERARNVIESCMLARLRIPEDIAVLGVNNDDFTCEMADEPISSIALNLDQAGYEAAELLDKMMKDHKRRTTKIVVEPTRVVVRHSTDILAVEDNYVREAIKYIRQHVREPIQVTDVARAVSLSRTALYEKFHRFLGYSAHQYIKRIRTEEIARLLVESDMSISEIALAMGFSSEAHIATYFNKHKGTNPSKYRRQFRD